MIEIRKINVNDLKIKKALIFDSSSIISLAMSNMLGILPKLKQIFDGAFLIPYDVFHESVVRPLDIKRFEFEAMMIKKLVDDGTLMVVEGLQSDTNRLLGVANTVYKAKGNYMKIMHRGEVSCIALYKRLRDNKDSNNNNNNIEKIAFTVDERTTRMLCENPYNLKELLSKKLHTNVSMDETKARQFSDIDIIRSTELGIIALKHGFISDLVSDKTKETIEALLYALRYNGCSISTKEINMLEHITH